MLANVTGKSPKALLIANYVNAFLTDKQLQILC